MIVARESIYLNSGTPSRTLRDPYPPTGIVAVGHNLDNQNQSILVEGWDEDSATWVLITTVTLVALGTRKLAAGISPYETIRFSLGTVVAPNGVNIEMMTEFVSGTNNS